MRSFVIVSPGLTLGRPGAHVGADKMGMDDDRLDAFVEAGHAIEIHDDDNPRPTGRKSTADTPLASLPKPARQSKGTGRRPRASTKR